MWYCLNMRIKTNIIFKESYSWRIFTRKVIELVKNENKRTREKLKVQFWQLTENTLLFFRGTAQTFLTWNMFCFVVNQEISLSRIVFLYRLFPTGNHHVLVFFFLAAVKLTHCLRHILIQPVLLINWLYQTRAVEMKTTKYTSSVWFI